MGAWLVAAASLQAHHSLAGVYDMKQEKEMSGSVSSVKFTNPHGSLTLTVKNADGSDTDWVFTLGSATALAQRGIGKTGPNALHAGELYGTCTPFQAARASALKGRTYTYSATGGHEHRRLRSP